MKIFAGSGQIQFSEQDFEAIQVRIKLNFSVDE